MPLHRSWVESANSPTTDFPLNNLPYGVFSADEEDEPRCGVAIGDFVLDLAGIEEDGLLVIEDDLAVFAMPFLNAFMECGPEAWDKVRAALTHLLRDGSRDRNALRRHLLPIAEVNLHLPVAVTSYTDFYAGRHHALNVGTMLRGPENALPPNWDHMPIGYNGRASTVVVSGTPVRRPLGQTRPAGTETPVFGPSRRLDYELELGALVGQMSEPGEPLTVAEARGMIFGHVLLNDWSARDIQAWEYQPLGPFQSKAFATTISPWVVTRAALDPFRCAGPAPVHPLLPYLREAGRSMHDIHLEAHLTPEGGRTATLIARTNSRHLSYSAAQQLAHHAVSGCAMMTGDLLGSGTISGPEKESRGCLLERTWGGREPVLLESGEMRSFLEDGDSVTLTGWAQGDGYRIGFGPCSGVVEPAPDEPAWEG